MKNFSVAINYGFYDLDNSTRFKLVKDAGFNAVGLWWGKPIEGFNITREEQFELARKYDLEINYVHAPFNYHKQLQLSGVEQLKAILEHFKWVDLCNKYNAKILVLHLNRLTNDEYITPNLIYAINIINNYAKSKNVKIAVENIGRPNDLKILFKNVENLFFCFDSSHAALNNDKKGKYLIEYSDNLICTHLSDNDLKSDCHWLIGNGEIDFYNINKNLKEIGYNGYINAEVNATNECDNPKNFLDLLYKRMDKYFG